MENRQRRDVQQMAYAEGGDENAGTAERIGGESGDSRGDAHTLNEIEYQQML